MKRIALALALLASMILAHPAAAAGTSHRTLQSFREVRFPAAHARAVASGELGAPSRQTVQSGAITRPDQLQEPTSIYPSDFHVISGSLPPKDADDPTLTELGYIHANYGSHFSYQDVAMLFGWAQRATLKLSDGSTFIIEYIASAYVTPDRAVNAFASLASFYTSTSNVTAVTCSVAGADQCLQITIPDAFTDNLGFPYNGVVRIVLKSNTIFEGAYFIDKSDYSANKSIADGNLDAITSNYIALVTNPSGTGPTPTPPTVVPTPTTPVLPTVTTTPTKTTPVPSNPVSFRIDKVQWEKLSSQPSFNDAALKKAKTGTKVDLVVFFTIESGPTSIPASITVQITKGGHAVGHSSVSGTVKPDPSGTGAFFQFKLPKTTGTYKATLNVTVGDQTQQASASIKVVKR